MKPLAIILLALFCILQYQIWISADGVREYFHLKSAIAKQTKANTKLTDHNAILQADIKTVKNDLRVIEDRARNEMGMVKKGEVFYQIVN